MGFIINIILGLGCAASVFCCSAMTPEQQVLVNEQLGDAAWIGDLPGVKKAIAAGADIHERNDYALFWAAGNGHLPVVRFLVERGADIHANNDYALRSAAGMGHWAVVQYLLELPEGQRADIHANNDYALRSAAGNGHWVGVVYLLQHGAERAVLSADQRNLLNKYLLSELAAALSRDDWHKVEELLSAVPVQELPQNIQQQIKAILIPAVQKKLDSVPLVLFARTQITNPQLALRTLSFIVGPKTAAAFTYLREIDTHEIAQ